jgi:hypothetical protein
MANVENHSYPLEGFARSSREMPGASYEEARRLEIKGAAAQETLVGLIRNVMHDQESRTKSKPPSKRRFAGLWRKTTASQQPVLPKSKVERADAGRVRRVLSSLRGMLWRILKPGVTKIKSYRPTAKHLCFVALAVVVFLRPWLIPITIVALLTLAAVIWLSLGPDRVSEFVHGLWLRLQARNPERAGKIRHRYQTGVTRINKILSRVPGRWAKRARLRDYADEERQQVETNLPDPFDRLTPEVGQEQEQG